MKVNKKYQIIYADPPWRYEHAISNSRKIENHYPTMELEDIKNLNVPAEDNSVLYLWVTAPKLTEGIDVMNAWNFIYRSCAVWDKEYMGMGYWFRNQHELLLVGVRGKFSPPDSTLRVSSVFKGKRQAHSQKPREVKQLISEWYPDKTKVELFARQNDDSLFSKSDWDTWGNEISNDIEL